MGFSEKVDKNLSITLLSAILIIVFSTLLLILASNEVTHYNDSQNLVMDGTYTEVEGIVAYVASSIPWDLHESLHPGDEISENFLSLNSIVKHVSEHYPKVSYIYTIRKEGDSFYFVLDSGAENDWDPEKTVGTLIEVVPQALTLAFSGQITHTDGFYHDEWGSFISGYAPISSPSGEVIAVLAVDISEDVVNEQIERVKNNLLIQIIVITTIGLIALFTGVYATLDLLKLHKFTTYARSLLLQSTSAAREGVFEYDLHNNMLLCGPETAKLFGYDIVPGIETFGLSKDFIISKTVYDDKKNVDDTLSSISKSLKGAKHKKFVYLWKFHVKNQIKTIQLKGYVKQGKRGIRVIGMAEDYTEQEKNKTTLISINKKMQMLHSISSHDIKNIITAIYTYADLILEEEVSDRVKTDLKQLIRFSEDSISTISSFSDMYTTLSTNLPEWIDLKALVNDLFRSNAELKGIKFTNNIDNLDIYASSQTNFVLQALFDFSIKYYDQVTSILMYTSISEGALHIIYTDDGVGISEEDKARIFDYDITKIGQNKLYIAKELLSITDISLEENGIDKSGTHFVITVKPGWFRVRESES
jgi:hypothetical protein